MATYFLSVLVPILAAPRGHVVNVYRVECSASLAWMREHADEIAERASGGAYDALMVSETDPEGEAQRAYEALRAKRERHEAEQAFARGWALGV